MATNIQRTLGSVLRRNGLLSYSGNVKIVVFTKIENHQSGRDNNKPQRNKDGQGWKRLTRIINEELEKLRLSLSRCTNRDVTALNKLSFLVLF